VPLFTRYVGHPLLGFHYIVYEEAMYAKFILKELKDIMKTVTK